MLGETSSTSKITKLLDEKRKKPTPAQKQLALNVQLWNKVIELITNKKHIPRENLRDRVLLKSALPYIAPHIEEINASLKSSIVNLIQCKVADVSFSGDKGQHTILGLLQKYYRTHIATDNLGQLVNRLTHAEKFQDFCNLMDVSPWGEYLNFNLTYLQKEQLDARNHEMIVVELQCQNSTEAHDAVNVFEEILQANYGISVRTPGSYLPTEFKTMDEDSDEVTAFIHYWPEDYLKVNHLHPNLSIIALQEQNPLVAIPAKQTQFETKGVIIEGEEPEVPAYTCEIVDGEEPEDEYDPGSSFTA